MESADKIPQACTEMVNELALVLQKRKNVGMIQSSISKKLELKSQCKLIDIIATIPERCKPLLLPRLKAKLVRTALELQSWQ
jgi:histone acetyltransferase (RNA polymerase elongator complex component)